MKPLATITGENGERIMLSYESVSGQLFSESFEGPTIQEGGHFATEESAAEYIHASWGNGWGLNWRNVTD